MVISPVFIISSNLVTLDQFFKVRWMAWDDASARSDKDHRSQQTFSISLGDFCMQGLILADVENRFKSISTSCKLKINLNKSRRDIHCAWGSSPSKFDHWKWKIRSRILSLVHAKKLTCVKTWTSFGRWQILAFNFLMVCIKNLSFSDNETKVQAVS